MTGLYWQYFQLPSILQCHLSTRDDISVWPGKQARGFFHDIDCVLGTCHCLSISSSCTQVYSVSHSNLAPMGIRKVKRVSQLNITPT